MNAQGFIPCEKTISSVKPIVLESWKERLLAERLIRKSAIVETFLIKTIIIGKKHSGGCWQEILD
jgi:hypothetical protein